MSQSLTVHVHHSEEPMPARAPAALAEALVLLHTSAALDDALAIAQNVRSETHPAAVRRHALEYEAEALREQLTTIEDALRRLAA